MIRLVQSSSDKLSFTVSRLHGMGKVLSLVFSYLVVIDIEIIGCAEDGYQGWKARCL